jgi:MYXO-CTERM domain-containing protein
MNLRVKLVFSIGLLCFLCLLLPGSLPAETIYTYTGNTFTACTNVFVDQSTDTCQGAVDLSFETSLIGSQLYNLSDVQIQSTLIFATATDGAEGYTGSIQCGVGCNLLTSSTAGSVQISTNAVGGITAWSIGIQNTNDGGNVTGRITSTNLEDTGHVDVAFGPVFCGGVPCRSVASVFAPGTWGAPVGTPEPAPGTLALIGLGGLLLLRQRRATQMEAS